MDGGPDQGRSARVAPGRYAELNQAHAQARAGGAKERLAAHEQRGPGYSDLNAAHQRGVARADAERTVGANGRGQTEERFGTARDATAKPMQHDAPPREQLVHHSERGGRGRSDMQPTPGGTQFQQQRTARDALSQKVEQSRAGQQPQQQEVGRARGPEIER